MLDLSNYFIGLLNQQTFPGGVQGGPIFSVTAVLRSSRNGLARPNFQAVSDVQIRLGENSQEDGDGVSGVSGHPGYDFFRTRWGRYVKIHGKIHDEVSNNRS